MPRCISAGCASGYDSNLEKVHFFTVPNNAEAVELWKNALRRKDFTVKPGQAVCEKHFLSKDILRHLEVSVPDGFVLGRALSTSNRLIHNVKPTIWEEEYRLERDKPISLRNPYKRPKQKCILCKLNIKPDYKNVRLLSQFQSRYTGRIYGRHITGLCKSQQQKVEQEILKAQNAGLMGYYTKDVAFCKDPKLFDPNHPFRSHKY